MFGSSCATRARQTTPQIDVRFICVGLRLIRHNPYMHRPHRPIRVGVICQACLIWHRPQISSAQLIVLSWEKSCHIVEYGVFSVGIVHVVYLTLTLSQRTALSVVLQSQTSIRADVVVSLVISVQHLVINDFGSAINNVMLDCILLNKQLLVPWSSTGTTMQLGPRLTKWPRYDDN